MRTDANTAPQAAVTHLRLADIYARLPDAGTLDYGDRQLVAAAIAVALKHHARAVDAELRQQGLHQRDDLIRTIAERFTGSVRARGRAVLDAAKSYAAGPWRHHRASTICPETIRGTVTEHLWRAFKSHPTFPTWLRQIQSIISRP